MDKEIIKLYCQTMVWGSKAFKDMDEPERAKAQYKIQELLNFVATSTQEQKIEFTQLYSNYIDEEQELLNKRTSEGYCKDKEIYILRSIFQHSDFALPYTERITIKILREGVKALEDKFGRINCLEQEKDIKNLLRTKDHIALAMMAYMGDLPEWLENFIRLYLRGDIKIQGGKSGSAWSKGCDIPGIYRYFLKCGFSNPDIYQFIAEELEVTGFDDFAEYATRSGSISKGAESVSKFIKQRIK
jgi:hypothetical protein